MLAARQATPPNTKLSAPNLSAPTNLSGWLPPRTHLRYAFARQQDDVRDKLRERGRNDD